MIRSFEVRSGAVKTASRSMANSSVGMAPLPVSSVSPWEMFRFKADRALRQLSPP